MSRNTHHTPCRNRHRWNSVFSLKLSLWGDEKQQVRLRSSSYAGHCFGLTPFAWPCHAKPIRAKRGGAGRDRTDDLLLAKQALSQLSYGPFGKKRCGSPPAPSGLRRGSLALISLRLSRQAHGLPSRSSKSEGWWAWIDSNYRPHAYQACALTT